MDETTADIEALKTDMKGLREDLAKLTQHVGERAAEKAKAKMRAASDAARDAAGGVLNDASEYREQLEETVREHPLAAVGIALVAGMVLSSMGRRH